MKKIDFLDVETSLKTHRLDVLFDRGSGTFSVQFGVLRFSDESFAALKERVEKAVRAAELPKFDRWIEFEYSQGFTGGWGSFEDRRRVGLGLAFHAVDYAGPFDVDDGKYHREQWLTRDVAEGDDGALVPSEKVGRAGEGPRTAVRHRQQHTVLVEFTPARWAALVAIRDGIGELCRRLEAFNDRKAARKFLDGLEAGRTLRALPPPGPRVEKGEEP